MLSKGIRLTPLWWRLGVDQTVARYRRTVLGPFWLASSAIATGLALSIVFGTLFGGDWRANFPYILSGVIAFGLASSLVADGAQTFINASGTMQIRKLPLSFYSLLQCDKTVINFAHQMVGFWIISLLLRMFPIPHWQLLFTIPLVVMVGFAASFPIGMISTRYRDVNYFVGFVLQMMFMLTPVFWRRSQIPVKFRFIVDFNPLAHMLEIVRQPMLGHPAPLSDLVAVIFTLFVSIILAIGCLSLFRKRVIFWL